MGKCPIFGAHHRQCLNLLNIRNRFLHMKVIVDAFNIERTIAGALYVIVKTLRRFICSSTGETAVLVPAPLFWFWRKFPSSAGHKSTVENLSPPRRVPRPCCGDAHLNNSYIMFEWLGIFSNQIGNGIISRMWLRTIPLSDDVKRWLQLSSHRQVEKFSLWDQYCTSTPWYWS